MGPDRKWMFRVRVYKSIIERGKSGFVSRKINRSA